MTKSFDTINLVPTQKVAFTVSWDLGPRCNYNCSYCPSYRHDNISPHASLESLKENADFVFEYINLYMKYRKYKKSNISFTGGEPTTNPNFIPFIQYLRKIYNEKYRDSFVCRLGLTSNGAMSEKTASAVIQNLDGITISYHTEADVNLKKQVLDRVVYIHNNKPSDFWLSLNIMFHAEYFDECIDVCKFLDNHKIKYIPRIIGEDKNANITFAHKYTESQIAWFKDYWNNNSTNKH